MPDLALKVLLQASDQASGTVKGFLGTLTNFAGAQGPVIAGLAAVGAAAVGVGAASAKAAADFQQSTLKIQAYAGLSAQQTQQMQSALLQMSVQVGQTPKQLADALYPIVSSGYSASDALNILNLSAKTAAASGAQTSVVADALTTSLAAMGAPASQASNYMDMLNKMVSQGKGDMPQYAAIIGKLSLTSKGAGIDFQQMGAALSTLTTHGFPSVAQASTSLGNLFTQIGVKTDTLAKHAASMGVSFDANAFSSMNLSQKMDYLNQITGGSQQKLLALMGGSKTALQAFDALSGGADAYAKNLKGMQNAQGTTNSAFATASSGFNASMARVQAAINVVLITIGQHLLPVLTTLANFGAQALTGLVTNGQKVVAFFQGNQTAMDGLKAALVGFGVFVGAIVIPAFIAWAIAAGSAAIATLAVTWPFILAGVVVGAVVFGILTAIRNWGAISKWLGDTWNTVLNALKTAFSDSVNFIKNVFGSIGAFFSGILKGIQSTFGNIGGWFHDRFSQASTGAKNGWSSTGNWFQTQGKSLQDNWNNAVQGVVKSFEWLYNHNYYFKQLVDTIVAVVKLGFTIVKTDVQAAINWVVNSFNWLKAQGQYYWNLLIAVITLALQLAQQKVDQALAAIEGFFTARWNTLKNNAIAAWNLLVLVITTALALAEQKVDQALQAVENYFTSRFNNIMSWVNFFWQKISGVFSSAWSAFIQSPLGQLLSNLVNWFEALPGKAYQWGVNLINGFINGLKNMAGAVGQEASNIASNIANFLGFHSPAKMGPGSELNDWPVNFVNTYAAGLQKGAPQIRQAVNTLALQLAPLNGKGTPSGTPVASGGSASGGTPVQYIVVNINAASANAKEVVKELSRQFKRSGNMITVTSGGRA